MRSCFAGPTPRLAITNPRNLGRDLLEMWSSAAPLVHFGYAELHRVRALDWLRACGEGYQGRTRHHHRGPTQEVTDQIVPVRLNDCKTASTSYDSIATVHGSLAMRDSAFLQSRQEVLVGAAPYC